MIIDMTVLKSEQNMLVAGDKLWKGICWPLRPQNMLENKCIPKVPSTRREIQKLNRKAAVKDFLKRRGRECSKNYIAIWKNGVVVDVFTS